MSNFNIGHVLALAASATEKERLAHVYRRVLRIPTAVEDHVKAALLLEIIEDNDSHSWLKHFQLAKVKWELQSSVINACEKHSIDRRQRANYMRLLMASNGRHRDVAYGLSELLLWRQKEKVIDKLVAMGKRDYHAPVPTNHVMDNGVLHVAISYKHTSSYSDKGTISEEQAEAIWTSVNSIFFVEENTEVRVWVDQNLHRTQFPSDRSWHEFGLLPYACLKTVFVGNGDCSLRLARTRPWLWVEMITALEGEGIYTKPGLEIVADSEGMLQESRHYDILKYSMSRTGWWMGRSSGVDAVMGIVTRTISLWRRDFLNHGDYEWADEFEHFVNWARRFVIRKVPYSEMTWNHSSDPVCGMDAVVLLRALPSVDLHTRAVSGIVLPVMFWKIENDLQKWVLEDIIDRSLVGEIPLSVLLELKNEQVDGAEELTMFGMYTSLEAMSLRKHNKLVSLVVGKKNRILQGSSPHAMAVSTMFDEIKMSMEKVVLTLPRQCQALMSYRPFTGRVVFTRLGALAVGDACLKPAVATRSVEEYLALERIGTCYNAGICEQVYAVDVDGMKWSVSTNEVNALLSACENNVDRFREIVKSLKMFCSYKTMRCKDTNVRDLFNCTRGRRIDNFEAENVKDCCFVSGEPEEDVANELIQMMRSQYEDYTLVWIDRAYGKHVRVRFARSHHIIILTTNPVATNEELAILKETNHDVLVNSESTGLVEMAIGIQPKVRVQSYGSGLNPKIQTHEDGKEVELIAVNGLFSTCDSCGRAVCNLNGLTASVYGESELVHVKWLEKHSCEGHTYSSFTLPNGTRII